ncbi:hypothetical protein BZM27_55215, partial [Paraburkholderia steynii]
MGAVLASTERKPDRVIFLDRRRRHPQRDRVLNEDRSLNVADGKAGPVEGALRRPMHALLRRPLHIGAKDRDVSASGR